MPTSVQFDITQSTGHALMVQLFSSTRLLGHVFPPCAAGTEMLRWRVCIPGPHASLQVDHFDQLPMTQSTGHMKLLHSFFSEAAPLQAAPLCFAVTANVLLRVWVPPPHVVEHLPHAVHLLHWQSTAGGFTQYA